VIIQKTAKKRKKNKNKAKHFLKYLPLFHHFKAIYQFPKHIICVVKIVANASLSNNKLQHYSQILFTLYSIKGVFIRMCLLVIHENKY
jgi:hypothetical protein